MVKPEDRIYHLGDVIFKKQGTLGLILKECPGDKILCKGNHDYNADGWYIRKGFSDVVEYYITNGILLSHLPLDIDEIEKETGEKIRYNIHGHFHRKNREEIDRGPAGYPFYSDKHLLIAIEEEDYKPILIEDFLKKKIL